MQGTPQQTEQSVRPAPRQDDEGERRKTARDRTGRGHRDDLLGTVYRLLARATQKARLAAEATATSTADRRCLHSQKRQQPHLARTDSRQSSSRTPCRDRWAAATPLSHTTYAAHLMCAGLNAAQGGDASLSLVRTRIASEKKPRNKSSLLFRLCQEPSCAGRWRHGCGRSVRYWP